MTRAIVFTSLIVLFAGCHSEPEVKGDPYASCHRSIVLDDAEVKTAGDALTAKLNGVAAKDPAPTIRVERIKNLTGRPINIDKLTDEARRRVVESNKYSVKAQPDAKTEFKLVGKAKDESVEFEVIDTTSDKAVLVTLVEYK